VVNVLPPPSRKRRTSSGRAQAGDGHFAPRRRERADEIDDARVIGHRRADEADAPRVGGDELEHALGRHRPHPAVGGPAHDAVRAAARAAPLGLDEEHAAQLGVGRDDLRPRG